MKKNQKFSSGIRLMGLALVLFATVVIGVVDATAALSPFTFTLLIVCICVVIACISKILRDVYPNKFTSTVYYMALFGVFFFVGVTLHLIGHPDSFEPYPTDEGYSGWSYRNPCEREGLRIVGSGDGIVFCESRGGSISRLREGRDY